MVSVDERTYFSVMPSPIGPLTLTSSGDALTGVMFEGAPALRATSGWIRDDGPLRETREQLAQYFALERTAFELPLDLRGTPFQVCVWSALRGVPYGETRSYGDLARAVGNPDAVRAVGAANGRNPIAIVVPCHRIIGADGSLTGFSGGLARKRALLELERHFHVRPSAPNQLALL